MSRPVDVHVGNRLKLLREKTGLSCSDLEMTLNIREGLITKFEDGSIMIRANELFQIAEMLQTTIGFFYKDAESKFEPLILRKNSESISELERHALS